MCRVTGMPNDARTRDCDSTPEGEQRLRRVLESLEEVVWHCRLDGTLEYLSPAVETVYGRRVSECLAAPDFWLQAVIADDRETAEASARKVLEQGACEVEYRILHTSGEVRWLLDRKRITYRDGEPIGLSGVAIDVTRRKKAESELARTAASLARAQAMACLGSWEYDVAVREGWWSKQLCEMFRRDPDSGFPSLHEFLELVHPEDQHLFDRFQAEGSFSAVALASEPVRVEFRSSPAHGPVRYFLGICELIRRDGRIILAGTVQDVTQHRQAELELNASRTRLRAVADSSPAMIAYVGADWRCHYVNARYEELCGIPAAKICGRRLQEVLPPELYEAARPQVERVLGGEQQQFEASVAFPGRAAVDLLVCVVPDVDVYGRVNGFYSVVTDTSVIKQAEASREAAQKELVEHLAREKQIIQQEVARLRSELVESTQRAVKGQLAAQIAHELRNPLGTVRNAVYLVRRDLNDDQAKLQSTLDLMDEELAAAEGIIRGLLEHTQPRCSEVKTVDVVAHIRAAFRRLGLPEDIALCLDAAARSVVIQCDPLKFRQLIDNLLNNAVRAVGRSGVIRVTVTEQDAAVRVEVSDTGPGIPAEIQDSLFQPFVKGYPDGVGLGLSICRQIVEWCGGRIWHEKGEEAGARIVATFPAVSD